MDLYQGKKYYEKKKQDMITKNEHDIKEKANQQKISSKSEKINSEIKTNVFKQLFYTLDEDKEGKIYGNKADLKLLHEPLNTIIEPLINELRDQDESLTEEEFLLACEHLYNVSLVKL